MKYSIFPLHLGSIFRKKTNMLYKCGDETLTEFPLISFLLVSDTGKKYLVDTGGVDPDGIHWLPYQKTKLQTIEKQLEAKGVDPMEIEAVFFTHLHWDHAGGNKLFSHSKLFVQDKEYKAIKGSELPGYDRKEIIQYEYTTLNGDTSEVVPGISVLLTPGHSVGSQTIVVDSLDGPAVFPGDLIPTFENISTRLPSAVHYDYDVIMESMDKIMNLKYQVFPGHEIRLFQ